MAARSTIPAREMTVLGIDLAYRSWRDVGSAVLSFTSGNDPAWTACRTDVIAWPDLPLSAGLIAEAINRFMLATGGSAVSIDGPQGWRDADAGDRPGVGRRCEYEARTPGKTGAIGVVYPRTYTPWVTFSIAVFRALLVRPHVTLVNDADRLRLDPPPPGQYYLLECFPTSTWRASDLAPLPGHAKAPPAVVVSCAQTLRERFNLPIGAVTGEHDHLQAVVAALPAAALLGGPCEAVPRGEAAHDEFAVAGAAPHCVEGLIWDARPLGWTKAYVQKEATHRRPAPARPVVAVGAPTIDPQTSRQAHGCLCGCGGTPKGGRFLPGHDARLKGALLRRIKGGDEAARNELRALGWEHFAPLVGK